MIKLILSFIKLQVVGPKPVLPSMNTHNDTVSC